MGLTAILRLDGRPAMLPDPSGGTFNAAGDFDRLLPLDPATWPMLGQLDLHDIVTFTSADLDAVAAEVTQLLDTAVDGPEQRGLLRLRELARAGRHDAHAKLIVTGD